MCNSIYVQYTYISKLHLRAQTQTYIFGQLIARLCGQTQSIHSVLSYSCLRRYKLDTTFQKQILKSYQRASQNVYVHCEEGNRCYFCTDVFLKCFQFPTFLPSVRRKIHPFLFSVDVFFSGAKYFSISNFFPLYPSPLWA